MNVQTIYGYKVMRPEWMATLTVECPDPLAEARYKRAEQWREDAPILAAALVLALMGAPALAGAILGIWLAVKVSA